MRLITCRYRNKTHIGVADGDAALLPVLHDGWRGRYADMLALIDAGARGLDELRDFVAGAGGGIGVAMEDVRLLAPIPRPRQNVICLGWNYADHVKETQARAGVRGELPEHPVVFTKDAGAVNGPYNDVVHDAAVSQRLDWEVELAVVVGRGGRKLEADGALAHVFGYTVANDITARDLQKRHKQFFIGKSLPGSCPMGPCIVTADEIADPQALALESRLNGEVKQSASTASQIFDVATVLSILSRSLALEPGMIISTGTPDGVGYARNPPEYLQPGDVIECEVERIGKLANRIVAAKG